MPRKSGSGGLGSLFPQFPHSRVLGGSSTYNQGHRHPFHSLKDLTPLSSREHGLDIAPGTNGHNKERVKGRCSRWLGRTGVPQLL